MAGRDTSESTRRNHPVNKKAEPQKRRHVAARRSAPPAPDRFPIVGIGASAGGLEAFQKFFNATPPDSGMAFILVQHLDPTHQSMMVELLSQHTSMPVQHASEGIRIEKDSVYIIPPGVYLAIKEGTLVLSKPRERHGARLPFDFLLHSMAEELDERAICVVLSGTGSDGSQGLKSIKEKGGLVVAQAPDDAGYDGMPRSAISTGAVDLVLPVGEMPEALARYARHPYVNGGRNGAEAANEASGAIAKIITLLRTKTSHDFTLYKPGTLQRRIERRAALSAVGDIDQYLEQLEQDDEELQLLAKDLLINVTGFFRDPQVFEFLAKEIVPKLVREHPQNEPIRIWVAGCSSGEETYSIAMLLREEIAAAGRSIKLQIFASDLDTDAIAHAREGVYSESIAKDVSPERLDRFFTKDDGGYRVVPALRELVVFAVQDVLADPPFSRLDLISCRNLLIYLQPEAQEKVLLLFHFALREGGMLLLGGSETVGHLSGRFAPVSKRQRLYRQIGRVRPGEVDIPIAASIGAQTFGRQSALKKAPATGRLGEVAQRILLDTYAPASVLMNRNYESLYYLGPTDRYLRVVPGEPSRDLLAMARDGLRNKLRAVVQQASRTHEPAVLAGALFKHDGIDSAVTIAVQPVQNEGEELLLVSFLDESRPEQKRIRTGETTGDVSRVDELERELDTTRAELQNTIRELETANEEQKAISEEAMSVSEEFQSTNEELVTSKEELQSLNEELTALNSQLQETLERQRSTFNDMQNILHSSDVATLFLDKRLNIRFFTPAVKSLFNVIASDIGRPITDLTPLASDPHLCADARTVLTRLVPLQQEVQTQNGIWYIRRVLPYRTDDDKIEGVVITFNDISEIKAAEQKIDAARAYSDSIINTVHQPLLVLDDQLNIVSANHAFYRSFALTPEQAVDLPYAAASNHLATIKELPAFLERIRTAPSAIADCEVDAELPVLGHRTLLLTAQMIADGIPEKAKILLAIDDITDRKHATEALDAARRHAEEANVGKSRFLAAASHDLRQPLQTLSLLQGILAKKVKDADTLKLVDRLEETLGAMSGMLNTLLDINQLEAGVVHPEPTTFAIDELFKRLQTEFAYHAAAHGLHWHVASSRHLVRSDPRLLEQMLRNLLSNAMKYTEHGKVLLGCRRRGKILRIEIWDTGGGIPDGDLQAIFKEFHQLDNPARERNRGLGLGLAIVHRLSELLGHAVRVRSRLGDGTVFFVDVPLGNEGAELARPHEHQETENSARQSTGTILLVEDDPDVREMLKLLLDDEGFDVVAAADGKEVLDLIERGLEHVDLIIADYNLPKGMTGLQIVERLHKTLPHHIPVIILTGDISTDTLRKISHAGYRQLNKPVRVRELTSLIETLLDQSTPLEEVLPSKPSEEGSASRTDVIFIVDDNDGMREAMRDLLQQNGFAVESYPSGSAFLDACSPDRDGCLLVDAAMPGMTGLELIQQMREQHYRLPMIMVTGHGDVHMAVRAMKAGASDFLEKPAPSDELLESISRALEQAQDSSKQTEWRDAATARLASLTPRQQEILTLILAGEPNKNIAADLGISQRTVENHRGQIMHKTGSKSLPALVRLALASDQAMDPKAKI